MRMPVFLFALSVLLNSSLHSLFAIEPPLDEIKMDKESTRMYTLECHVVGKAGCISFNIPKMTIHEGEKAMLKDISQKTLTLATQIAAEMNSRELKLIEGTTVEATVVGAGKNKVLLDFSFEASGHPSPKHKKDGQVRWIAENARVIECVTLGKKTVASFEKMDLEIVVKAFPETAPETTAALPISVLAWLNILL